VAAGEFCADRRRADGSRSFWATSEQGRMLSHWEEVDHAWSAPSTSPAASWREAVAADPDLVAVRSDELTEFTAPTTDALLDLLVVCGADEPDDQDWSFDVDDWEADDEDFRFEEGQIRRYARVNGQRVQFVEAGAAPVAIVASDDDLIGGTEIAELVWNNGGDPGIGHLYSVRSGVAVGLERGDAITQIRGFRYRAEPRDEAQLLVTWLHFADGFGTGGGAAAVALEPLDPKGTLTPEQRAEWDDALAEQRDGWDYTFRVSFDVPDAVKDEIRAILGAEDDEYVRVRDALANPIEGDWLRADLSVGQTDALW
jgi:hypothetical protein